MAEFFEQRNPNLIYMPGFYPPFAYTADQLGHHVETALRGNGHYWMLGPHEELSQEVYQAALSSAYRQAKPHADISGRVELSFFVEAPESNSPVLVVKSENNQSANNLANPTLSLWSAFGGASLCEDVAMVREGGQWTARIALVRRITNNRHLGRGYRSGATYKLSPVPLRDYADPHHTKLVDGRAYGYFGTTVAWPKSQPQAQVVFDFHRAYSIVRIEVAQPGKLEDRIGGPSELARGPFPRPERPRLDRSLVCSVPTYGPNSSCYARPSQSKFAMWQNPMQHAIRSWIRATIALGYRGRLMFLELRPGGYSFPRNTCVRIAPLVWEKSWFMQLSTGRFTRN